MERNNKEKQKYSHIFRTTGLRRVCSMILTFAMCITMLPVTTVTTQAALPPTMRTTACKEHQNWTYHSDASSHHHKYCYDCGKQFDYEE